MVSNGLTSTLGRRALPFLAILRHDLGTQLGSWLVRAWLAAAAVLTLLVVASAWAQVRTAPFIATILVPWLVGPWFVVVMVLGVNPVSGSRAEALADGFLSRPIARHEYLLAIWAARVLVVLGIYLVVVVPAIALVALADRKSLADEVTFYGLAAALGVVALVLTLQVSLAFLAGIVLRRPLPAFVVLLFLWYPVNVVLDTFKLEAFSPITLSRALPTLLRAPQAEGDAKPVESAKDRESDEAARQLGSISRVIFGGPPEPPPPKPGFFERDEFREFSLTKVLLGYGIPTLAALGLATLCFCRRDL
jgi:ABC-type transport system involved in multi-copper enzyme maturation permease subunit